MGAKSTGLRVAIGHPKDLVLNPHSVGDTDGYFPTGFGRFNGFMVYLH